MKRILLYSTLALGTGLFSCSQEDLMEQGSAPQAGRPVTISVQLPSEVGSDAVSRALSAIPDGHQLRCILYVSGNGETPVRQETVLADAGGTISFTFTPATDTYTCSFWADFVSGTDTNADGRYDDLYYDTQRIPDVTYSSTLADGHSFYNNDACDAFTGHFTAAEVRDGTVVLKRPFAKVNFKEKTSEVSGNIAVTGYAVNNGMNITDGKVSETRENLPDYSGAVAGDGVWFCNYLFADGKSTRLPESISMTVGDGGATSISTDGRLLNANTQYNLSFEANEGEVVPAPQVGDYFFTDGTWASSLVENKNVAGVVFAVKGDGTGSAIENDVIGNYSDANGATDVLAWVVAAKDAGSGKKFYTGSAANLPSGLGTDGANDIEGYANTGLWYTPSNTEYEAVATAKAYDVTITGETPNSGWYLPAAGQLMALVNVYAENNNNDQGNALAVKNSLQALVKSEQTDGTALMGSGYYWTSSGSMSNGSVAAYRVGFHETEYYGKNGANTNLASGSYVRPVLTIFKSAN